MREVIIIGGGLAGSEAAWQLARRNIPVCLYEMRNETRRTPAHQTSHLAELVCSNSFRNDAIESAIGVLHEEMRKLDSLIMRMADKHKVPAGGALAMDRDGFAQGVEAELRHFPHVRIVREECLQIPTDTNNTIIIASGPLTSDHLAEDIIRYTGRDYLAFFDAIAPIIYKESIDFSVAWFQSRYDKTGPAGTGSDYINCPLSREQYYQFIDMLLKSEKSTFKEWEANTPYFDGCLPIEVMAERGKDTLAFGPMKPVGLRDPRTQTRPFAVVQLRQDNALGTLYNMVGFQTKLKYAEQTHVFRTIPGLEQAEFARLGGLHRNSFIQSPLLLNSYLQLKSAPHLMFAGQITGVEGYVESAAMGLLAGRFVSQKQQGIEPSIPPRETALGSLLAHITGEANPELFQPMNINFGLFPPLPHIHKSQRKAAYATRALAALDSWIHQS
jgi:methylenetetrahydrofolate--tRNA-(uracil-5-)-methyltransferase